MYKIITVKANAHEVHNTERPTKGSGHGKMIDPRRNSTYERPFTQEGNYLVNICVEKWRESKETAYIKNLSPNPHLYIC